jgi:hypothetical protein
MNANVGTADRAARVIVGLGLILASLYGFIGLWGWVGALPLLTGAFGFCPAYLPFGLNTCGKKN